MGKRCIAAGELRAELGKDGIGLDMRWAGCSHRIHTGSPKTLMMWASSLSVEALLG